MSSLLLVDRTWCRIGTPLLYHDVVLRSKAQAVALAAALKSNPGLSRWVRKLRVEGGFGPSMKHILQKCGPYITDICLMIALYSAENANGLASSLSALNPTGLVLLFPPGRRPSQNKNASNLFEALAQAVPTWNNLRSLDTRYLPIQQMDLLSRALQSSTSLQIVILGRDEALLNKSYRTFCKIPCVKEVILADNKRRPILPFEEDVLERVLQAEPPEVRAKLVYRHTLQVRPSRLPVLQPESTDISPTEIKRVDPSFVPLASAPSDIADRIWSRILWHAAQPKSLPWISDNFPRRGMPSYLLVCKAFYKASLPWLYERISLFTVERTSSLLAHLQIYPDRATHIKAFIVSQEVLRITYEGYPQADGASELLLLLRQVRNLESFCTRARGFVWVPWSVVVSLAEGSGATLRDFERFWTTSNKLPVDPTPLCCFARLRTLVWDSPVSFDEKMIPAGASLPALEEIEVKKCHVSFAMVLASMRLDCLNKITVRWQDTREGHGAQRGLLLALGPKLRDLVLWSMFDTRMVGHCPNMKTLTVYAPVSGAGRGFSAQYHDTFEKPHQNLARIVVRPLYGEDSSITFVDELKLVNYPALREIHIDCLEWPATERDILKSRDVKVAERLLPLGVKVCDGKGVPWTPRLR